MSDIIKKEQLPSYIPAEDAGMGLDNIDQFIRPGWLKVVQKQSDSELYGDYETGTLLLMPDKVVFANKEKKEKEGAAFYFVPLLFYTEYVKCNPIGSEQFIVERTHDINSELAQKARDPERWSEPHPTMEGKSIRYQENLNFIVMPYPEESEFFGEPIVMTFSRGSHKEGTRLLSHLRRRRNIGLPIFACVIEAFASPRKNNEGDWMVVECQNPSADSGMPSQVKEVHYPMMRELHIKLKTAAEENRVIIYYDDEVEEAKPDLTGM